MKIEIKENKKTTTCDMKVGDIARILDTKDGNIVLLKTYNEFVNLHKPKDTWCSPDFEVEIYPPGTRIIITVE